MKQLQVAIDIVRSAEVELSEQLQLAIGSNEFVAARRLLDAIASMTALRSQLSSGEIPTAGLTSIGLSNVGAANSKLEVTDDKPANAAAPRSRASRYPLFERESSRLVKIGWSSKEKRTDEHRVALDVVRDVCAGLATTVRGKKPLKVEELLPLKSAGGTDIPSYQVYLVLKWLQYVKAVQRKGKDGYVFVEQDMSTETIHRLLHSTPERGAK